MVRVLVTLARFAAGCAIVACAQVTSDPVDEAAEGVVTQYPDEGAAAFIAAYPELEHIGTGIGVLLFPKGSAQIVDRLRSELPRDHQLFNVSDFEANDRVLALVQLPGTSDQSYFVVSTEGPSYDTGFYLVGTLDTAETSDVSGEILALPASGDFAVFQRRNSMFAKRQRARVESGTLVAIEQAFYHVGLRSVTLDTITLTRSAHGGPVAARLDIGTVVEVLATDNIERDSYMSFLVRVPAGVRGWARINVGGSQCRPTAIRGICYLGD